MSRGLITGGVRLLPQQPLRIPRVPGGEGGPQPVPIGHLSSPARRPQSELQCVSFVPARDLGQSLDSRVPWGLHQGSHALPLCAEPQYFRFEGVWLTETGMAVLRNLTMSPLHKRRQRRGRPGLPGEPGLEGSEPSDALGPDDKKDGDLDADELLKGEGQAGASPGVSV